jgi:quercetin dioxygenase-like cupin family protein
MRILGYGWPTVAVMIACIGGAALGADDPAGDIKPLASVKFAPDPDVKCLSSAVETGDPNKGRSTLILKAPSGCVVPWHSHTAEEQLIVITGNVKSEMLDHEPARLGPGGFAVMGSRMPHQFTCLARPGCLMFVAFDGPYDIFWGRGR